ncbi:MAG: 2-phosphosulfolactate phosphatase [Clostridiales bacterium]|nr:2-phosphosulfolactate phosphatase [Clostridiales bacterium]
MDIKIHQLIEGAKCASGLSVIIDVFRAFTTACYVINNGAKEIIPVGDIELAYKLKKENPDYLLMGERKGRIQPGFDFGNSPAQIENVDFSGRTIVQTTSAGTQGIVNAVNAEEIITGSFVNAQAIVRYIQLRSPKEVSLVCMGYEGIKESDEDTFCAEYIKSSLEGTPYDFGNAVEKLKKGAGRRFFDQRNLDCAPEKDFYLSTDLNKFDFVLKADKNESGLYLFNKISI